MSKIVHVCQLFVVGAALLKFTFVVGDVQLWASTHQIPIVSNSIGEWTTRVEKSNVGARLRRRFCRGLSASVDLGTDENASLINLCKGVTFSTESDVMKDGRVKADVTLKFPSKAVNFVYSGCLPNYGIEIEYDTEKSFGTIRAAAQRRIYGGESTLHLEGDLTSPFVTRETSAESSLPKPFLVASSARLLTALSAAITMKRDKEGDVDAHMRIKHSFNEGRDSFSSLWKLKDRFPCGSRLKAVVEGRKSLKLEFLDMSCAGGRWVANADLPLNQPAEGTIQLKREFVL